MEIRQRLLLEVAKCREVKRVKYEEDHPCRQVVKCQEDWGITDFQLPEPWNGKLGTAEILYISTCPIINRNKKNSPTAYWNDEDTINFFENRFADTLERDWSKYWRTLNKWTGWILNMESWTNLLQDHAAATEIVHCRAQNEKNVTPPCAQLCFEKWLKKILMFFKGKYVVVVGNIAEELIKNNLEKELANKKVAYTATPLVPVAGLTDEVRKESILSQLGLLEE